jgi:probable phosphoglycerate mutase
VAPLVVIARHAHSELNRERRVNGDPSVNVGLTETGRAEAKQLGAQLSSLPLDVCIHTRFPRTRETATIALAQRDVPFEIEPELDDVKLGDVEGWTIERYRELKEALGRTQPFPGGESLDDAAARYAQAFARIASRPEQRILVVCHEIPLRYALNAAAGSTELDGPPFHEIGNAVPYLFDSHVLAGAAARIAALASS